MHCHGPASLGGFLWGVIGVVFILLIVGIAVYGISTGRFPRA